MDGKTVKNCVFVFDMKTWLSWKLPAGFFPEGSQSAVSNIQIKGRLSKFAFCSLQQIPGTCLSKNPCLILSWHAKLFLDFQPQLSVITTGCISSMRPAIAILKLYTAMQSSATVFCSLLGKPEKWSFSEIANSYD